MEYSGSSKWMRNSCGVDSISVNGPHWTSVSVYHKDKGVSCARESWVDEAETAFAGIVDVAAVWEGMEIDRNSGTLIQAPSIARSKIRTRMVRREGKG